MLKNLLRKNQIIITALVIMIAVAGYLRVSQKQAANTAEEANGTNITEEMLDISDEDIVVTEEDENKSDENADVKTSASPNAEATEAEPSDVAAKDNAGEAVLVSSQVSADYFESARLSREQTRSQNKEALMELVNNANTSEKQKEKAINSIVALTTSAEKETVTESLLEAKGFSDSLVSIVDDSVEVIVNGNDLAEKQIAQIEDIVKRKTDVGADKIVITPVGTVKEEK